MFFLHRIVIEAFGETHFRPPTLRAAFTMDDSSDVLFFLAVFRGLLFVLLRGTKPAPYSLRQGPRFYLFL